MHLQPGPVLFAIALVVSLAFPVGQRFVHGPEVAEADTKSILNI